MKILIAIMMIFFISLVGEESIEFKVEVKPVAPSVLLTRKQAKPKVYKFFREFDREMQQVPKNLFDLKSNLESVKVKDYGRIVEKDKYSE
ncbi:MAG: hypothetical protein JXR48_16750 [Candidatus Delongbacteria bacterium]|nr:hypothetical protein [Candidatus Delongbacteria bacterium]MBN2836607.1 hypothetical protein [Candidatus Delongbacteria bacterium]